LQLHGRYLPLKKLGTGGFAVTYVVYDLRSQSEQVLKVLLETVPKAVELFEQEAQVLASLHHPGVPRVEPGNYFQVQVGSPTRRSLPCLVMEKINGQTLQDVAEQYPKGCPEGWVVGWLYQAIDILKELHERQIVHRDLKPANLMLRQGTGQLVMIDFGGAKQMRLALPFAQPSSTRLVSPGYSPPEQIAGGGIQPASDFYALGRTLIHLLTGRYPAELEDPMTGELRWRTYAQVSPALADLLDDLVRSDARQRPATADAVLARLSKIAARPRLATGGTLALPGAPPATLDLIKQSLKAAQQIFRRTTTRLWRLVISILQALLDTIWSTIMAAIGAILGTALGYAIAYQTSVGSDLAAWLSQQMTQGLPTLQTELGADLLLFGFAGLGTAWGLTLAGGFGQRRRVWISGLMGILGYLFGWVGLHLAQADGAVAGLTVFGAIAPALLTIGLGMRSSALIHALVVACGIAPLVAVLTALNTWFTSDLWQLTTTLLPDGSTLGSCLVFFSLLGGSLGCYLGVSYYLFVPLLRWMDWH
jgi:Protein kinase domain